MARINGSGSSSSIGNQAESDAKNAAKAAAAGAKAVKEGVTDAKAIAQAAAELASGNVVGAAKTAVTHPKTVLKVIALLLVLALMPLIVFFAAVTFIVALPGSIVESAQAAIGKTVDDVTLGWEDFKAQLSNGIDDFLTFLTTGTWGTSSQEYKDDIATAEDDNFAAYTGTSNVMVGVLNNYFRDEYEKYSDKAISVANETVEEYKQKAISEDVSPEYIRTTVDKEIYDGKNYLNWTFYIMAGESCQSRNESGIQLHVSKMVDAAKKLKKSNIWRVAVTPTYGTRWVTRVWYTPEEETHTEDVLDENGNPVYDENGNKKTTTVTTTTQVKHSEQVKCADINVKYKCVPKDGARRYILDYFHVSNEKENDSDMSDEDIVDEQVAQLRKMYNAKDAAFSDSSDLEIGADVDIGNVVSGKDIQAAIDSFYATHSDDELFDAPEPVQGPWSGWSHSISSDWGEEREINNGNKHNGTDIRIPQHATQLIAGSKCIVAEIVKGNANGSYSGTWNGDGARGNYTIVYYGQWSDGKGLFAVYQHLSPALDDCNWNVGDTIQAGSVIGRTGYTGYCVSAHKHGTGEHLHLETHLCARNGTSSQVDPKEYMTE